MSEGQCYDPTVLDVYTMRSELPFSHVGVDYIRFTDINGESRLINLRDLRVEFSKAVGTDSTTKDPWAHRAEQMRCPTCMWAVFGSPTSSVGRCRRHAPTMSGYPAVYRGDWCGDHKVEKS